MALHGSSRRSASSSSDPWSLLPPPPQGPYSQSLLCFLPGPSPRFLALVLLFGPSLWYVHHPFIPSPLWTPKMFCRRRWRRRLEQLINGPVSGNPGPQLRLPLFRGSLSLLGSLFALHFLFGLMRRSRLCPAIVRGVGAVLGCHHTCVLMCAWLVW